MKDFSKSHAGSHVHCKGGNRPILGDMHAVDPVVRLHVYFHASIVRNSPQWQKFATKLITEETYSSFIGTCYAYAHPVYVQNESSGSRLTVRFLCKLQLNSRAERLKAYINL